MTLLSDLEERSNSHCELCTSDAELHSYLVPPRTEDILENKIAVCKTCQTEIDKTEDFDIDHLRFLNESIWSITPAVKVVSYRLLKKLTDQPWSVDLINSMYMEPETLEWAEQGLKDRTVVHIDSNGNTLENGDNVTLIQDLKVKGGGFTAKRGTAVRRIRLVADNSEHIEGKVEGQSIVILTKYVKKS